jgi:cytochrome c oxidase assembly protein subunit 15
MERAMEHSVSLPGAAGAQTSQAAHGQVAAWLLLCCALVFAMVVVGGVTRLTHSGLSMVEWQPIVGTIPPLDQNQWREVFEKYQQTPEYQKVNRGMSLDEFKGIFWWEYFHRLLGRAIGVVFFVPLLYFVLRGKVDRRLATRLTLIFLLGAAQGALGWYMVKSGLVDDPRVSQYRLTAHLGLAFLIYAAMFWTALELLAARARAGVERRPLYRYAAGLSVLVFVMVLSGGLVAGTHAGLAYNTFPLMNGQVIPSEYFMLQPWYSNLFNNMAAVQFDHRSIAWLLFLFIPWFWWRARRVSLPARARLAVNLLPLALALQISLGISTLLLVVPIALAAAHQAGALVLFTSALWATKELR